VFVGVGGEPADGGFVAGAGVVGDEVGEPDVAGGGRDVAGASRGWKPVAAIGVA
jgi:hypothetical protein